MLCLSAVKNTAYEVCFSSKSFVFKLIIAVDIKSFSSLCGPQGLPSPCLDQALSGCHRRHRKAKGRFLAPSFSIQKLNAKQYKPCSLPLSRGPSQRSSHHDNVCDCGIFSFDSAPLQRQRGTHGRSLDLDSVASDKITSFEVRRLHWGVCSPALKRLGWMI